MNLLKSFLLVFICVFNLTAFAQDPVVVAYLTSWKDRMPNPQYMTHINYAFGHVTDDFKGVRVDNPERLRAVVALKKQNPKLKVLVSVGGWGSGRFSEMAADKKKRQSFAKDCKRLVQEFGLDGIDIDWEYPTQSSAGISSSPEDSEHFTLLMHELRKQLGKDKQLTLATVSTAQYMDFPSFIQDVDFVNIMAYDMADTPLHHSALHRSAYSGTMTTDKAIQMHLDAGVPKEKLVCGLAFYGHAAKDFPHKNNPEALKNDKNYKEMWDEVGQVPYYTNTLGEPVYGPENERSLAIKCQYIKDQGLRGAMYWEAAQDTPQLAYSRTVYKSIILGEAYHERHYNVLLLAEGQGQHKPMTDAAIKWLVDESQLLNFTLQVMHSPNLLKTEADFNQFDLIIQMDYPPYAWNDDTASAFIKYMQSGKGAWIGFHHATLLGEFDGYEMWDWFSKFMGGIRYDNYIAPLADGKVEVENPEHPVMEGVNSSFVIPDDEWYTYDKSPRPNVQVLATVNESTYTPMSSIKMGDHPVVWINPAMASRNIYFQMGHSPKLYQNDDFTRMFHNALKWVLQK